MKIFHGATVVLGLHGGAFANIGFCRENTTVIEINLGSIWRRDCYAVMALANQLIYHRYGWDKTHNFYNRGRIHLNTSDLLLIANMVAAGIKQSLLNEKSSKKLRS